MKNLAVALAVVGLALASCSSRSFPADQAEKSLCVHIALLGGVYSIGLPVTLAEELVPALQADAHLFIEAGEDGMVGGILSLAAKLEAGIHAADKADVVVYLDRSITPERRIQLEEHIRGMSSVVAVDYESQFDAYRHFKELYKDQPALIQNVSADALPASFRIRLRDTSVEDAVRAELVAEAGVDHVTAPAINLVTVDASEELASLMKDSSCERLFPAGSPSGSE